MSNYGNSSWILTPQMGGRLYKIIDLSGTDWFDFTHWSGRFTYNLSIDLRPASYYNPLLNYDYGYRLQISARTIIENMASGAGNDRIYGMQGNDALYGEGGDDLVLGLPHRQVDVREGETGHRGLGGIRRGDARRNGTGARREDHRKHRGHRQF